MADVATKRRRTLRWILISALVLVLVSLAGVYGLSSYQGLANQAGEWSLAGAPGRFASPIDRRAFDVRFAGPVPPVPVSGVGKRRPEVFLPDILVLKVANGLERTVVEFAVGARLNEDSASITLAFLPEVRTLDPGWRAGCRRVITPDGRTVLVDVAWLDPNGAGVASRTAFAVDPDALALRNLPPKRTEE